MKSMGKCHGALKNGQGVAKSGVIGHGRGTGTTHGIDLMNTGRKMTPSMSDVTGAVKPKARKNKQ